MKKFFLVIFILADLVIMGASGFLLYMHLTSKHLTDFKSLSSLNPIPAAVSHPAAVSQPQASTGNLTSPILPPASTPAVGASSGSHIGFKYRNPRAKKVSIRADFTGWKADPMHSDGHGIWTYQASLSPGEYAYVFAVDNKPPFNDPSNKRTKRIGTTLVSAIVVKPPH